MDNREVESKDLNNKTELSKNKTNSFFKSKLFVDLVVLVSIGLLLMLLVIAKNDKELCEWWTRNISRKCIWLSGHITGWFNFSLFEFLCVVAVVALIAIVTVVVVRFCRHKGFFACRLLAKTLCVVLGICCVYTIFTGFAYNRAVLPLKVLDEEISRSDVYDTAEYFVEQLNEASALLGRTQSGEILCPYTTKELSDKLKQEYKRMDGMFDGYFNQFTPSAKSITFSKFMSETQIVGIFFAVTGEANVNTDCPKGGLAVNMAHEMAHGKGVMRENDANLIAYYITLTSDDDYLRYSGLYSLVYTVLAAVSYYPNSLQEYGTLKALIATDIINEYKLEADYWQKHKFFADIEEWFNDLYLKLNGIEDGTGSYADLPDNTYDDQNLDNDGRPIASVINFSRVQKLVFDLVKQNLL